MCVFNTCVCSVPWIKQFKMVLNALDNVKARNHVNRLCLAAEVPLVESATAGYLGEISMIRKGHTQCYECRVSFIYIQSLVFFVSFSYFLPFLLIFFHSSFYSILLKNLKLNGKKGRGCTWL